MPDKTRERFYLDQLRVCLPDLPGGKPLEPEPPDFILAPGVADLGIEMTSFYYPPAANERPWQETASLRQRVVRLAQRRHGEAGGRPLYVTVSFKERSEFRKKDIPILADRLVATIRNVVPPSDFSKPTVELFDPSLPPEIASIGIHASIDGRDQLWYATFNGWVAPVAPEHVQAEINRKAHVLRNVKNCKEVWLVLVQDIFSSGAPSELSKGAGHHEYHSDFHRVIWLEPHAPRVRALTLVEAA